MEILLVRHAKSLYDWEKYPTDAERPLSNKGRERQSKVAKNLLKLHLTYDLAWVSPYKRAQETLAIMQDVMGKKIPVIEIQELVPAGDEDQVIMLLRKQAIETPAIRLLVVSHNPLISALLEEIDSSDVTTEMKTSDVAYCEITSNNSRLIKFYSRKELMVK